MTVSRKKAQEAVNKVLEGYRVVIDEPEAADANDAPLDVDDTTPDIETLRRKYLGSAEQGTDYDLEADLAEGDVAVDEDEDESGLVRIEPESGSADPGDGSSRPLTAVISKDGRVTGLQG